MVIDQEASTFMSKPPTTLLVVDDNTSDVQDVLKLQGDDLSVQNVQLQVSAEVTAAAVVDNIPADAPSLILVDYRLDSLSDARYRGGSLAGAIRDLNPSVPLVLYTSDAILQDEIRARPKAREAFDWTLEKNHFIQSPDVVRDQLMSIAAGFVDSSRHLTTDPRNALIEVLSPPQSSFETVQMMNPGYSGQSGPGLASWVLNTVLVQDGPLISELQLAAELGVNPGSVALLRSELAPAAYHGVFSGMRDLWWLDEIRATSYSLEGLSPATCNWCGRDVQRSCVSCGLACGEAHAVPVLDVIQSNWTRGHVICFCCVEDGRDRGFLIDPAFEDVAESLRSATFEQEA